MLRYNRQRAVTPPRPAALLIIYFPRLSFVYHGIAARSVVASAEANSRDRPDPCRASGRPKELKIG
jgi:hypothetical protein